MKKLLLLLIVLALLITSCTTQGEPIKIGAILPLTGERADDAQSIKNGIDLAVTEINQRNTLKGPIRVIYEDSKCNAKEAEKAAVQLVLADGVRAIIGDICPDTTVAISQIAKSNNVVLLNLAPNITEQDYMFTVEGNASQVFIKLYEKVYNQTPNAHAAQGYTAVKMLTEALQETDYTGRKLNEKLSG